MARVQCDHCDWFQENADPADWHNIACPACGTSPLIATWELAYYWGVIASLRVLQRLLRLVGFRMTLQDTTAGDAAPQADNDEDPAIVERTFTIKTGRWRRHRGGQS